MNNQKVKTHREQRKTEKKNKEKEIQNFRNKERKKGM